MTSSTLLHRSHPSARAWAFGLASLASVVSWHAAAAQSANTCSARSGSAVTPVVELYTSEGCNSCPPADRWLSRLVAQPDVVALAFHVDYWDRLGWKDRFASAAFTVRQVQQQGVNGARFSYTPQVVVDGVDRPGWPSLPSLRTPTQPGAAAVSMQLDRDAERFTATVTPGPGSPARLAAYWAMTEQNHVSAVKAGENEGVTLKHDFVVREYQPVAAWGAQRDTAHTLSYSPAVAADPAHPRHVNLVVVDAATGRPVQALKLGC